jgi:hypothetical protein
VQFDVVQFDAVQFDAVQFDAGVVADRDLPPLLLKAVLIANKAFPARHILNELRRKTFVC